MTPGVGGGGTSAQENWNRYYSSRKELWFMYNHITGELFWESKKVGDRWYVGQAPVVNSPDVSRAYVVWVLALTMDSFGGPRLYLCVLAPNTRREQFMAPSGDIFFLNGFTGEVTFADPLTTTHTTTPATHEVTHATTHEAPKTALKRPPSELKVHRITGGGARLTGRA